MRVLIARREADDVEQSRKPNSSDALGIPRSARCTGRVTRPRSMPALLVFDAVPARLIA